MRGAQTINGIGLWLLAGVFAISEGIAGELPVIADVERQPFVAATRRVTEALSYAGAPLTTLTRARKAQVYIAVVALPRKKKAQRVGDR